MKYEKGLEGRFIRLNEAARWRNYCDDEERIMPEGTVMRLISWRPEGYQAETVDGKKYFFLFARFIETATEEVR